MSGNSEASNVRRMNMYIIAEAFRNGFVLILHLDCFREILSYYLILVLLSFCCLVLTNVMEIRTRIVACVFFLFQSPTLIVSPIMDTPTPNSEYSNTWAISIGVNSNDFSLSALTSSTTALCVPKSRGI